MQWWLLGAVVLAALFAWYLSTTAARLDRLNKRVETSLHSLDTQLLRRVSLVTEVAGSGLLDPVSAELLADAAHQVRVAPQDHSDGRALAESNLTGVLNVMFDDPENVAALRGMPGGAQVADEIDVASRRLTMSRRFLNDGVRANRDLRRQKMVRWFRLQGTSQPPQTFEFDDRPPRGFGTR